MLCLDHTLNWVGAEGGLIFRKFQNFLKKSFRGGQFAIVPTLSPPPSFCSQGGTIFFTEGGGPDPDSLMNKNNNYYYSIRLHML